MKTIPEIIEITSRVKHAFSTPLKNEFKINLENIMIFIQYFTYNLQIFI